jgi:uncharacterized protein
MSKQYHEVRDPIHIFIKYDDYERGVLDSQPFQRLRHIHQLGMTYLLYPGATHRRFEHSLGVMELAGKVYDVITHPNNLLSKIKDILPELEHKKDYWRDVIRMAGLCHDIGHLPFSHAAEDLLPKGWNHERLTVELIFSDEMQKIWKKMKIAPEDVAKLAVGPKIMKMIKDIQFSTWEALLSEIITGNAFGVDRMDYLLRDSHHAGVAYGNFDHNRLIDTLRILPKNEDVLEPTLGIEYGGIHAAEALLLARYFMFTQMYLHPVRRIYDLHLKDFLHEYLPGGKFNTDLSSFIHLSDNQLISAMMSATEGPASNLRTCARRIINRNHFKVMYRRHPADAQYRVFAPGRVIYEAAKAEFGDGSVRYDTYSKEAGAIDFPVLYEDDGRIMSSLSASEALSKIPDALIDFVFIDPDKRDEAQKWLEKNREKILIRAKEKGEEE